MGDVLGCVVGVELGAGVGVEVGVGVLGAGSVRGRDGLCDFLPEWEPSAAYALPMMPRPNAMARITVKLLRMAYSLTYWAFGLEASMLQVLFQRTGRAWAGKSGEAARRRRTVLPHSISTISTQFAPFPAGYFCSNRNAPLDGSIA